MPTSRHATLLCVGHGCVEGTGRRHHRQRTPCTESGRKWKEGDRLHGRRCPSARLPSSVSDASWHNHLRSSAAYDCWVRNWQVRVDSPFATRPGQTRRKERNADARPPARTSISISMSPLDHATRPQFVVSTHVSDRADSTLARALRRVRGIAEFANSGMKGGIRVQLRKGGESSASVTLRDDDGRRSVAGMCDVHIYNVYPDG